MEIGTSSPTARLRALRHLQDAGVPTYGMLCPVFPDAMASGDLDRLLDAIRPERCETVWAEVFNDRANWRAVRDGYEVGSYGHTWLGRVYEKREPGLWSSYATSLYLWLLQRGDAEKWTDKLQYLLYEEQLAADDAPRFEGLRGVLLQSSPNEDGFSANPHVAPIERAAGGAGRVRKAEGKAEKRPRRLPMLEASGA